MWKQESSEPTDPEVIKRLEEIQKMLDKQTKTQKEKNELRNPHNFD